MNLRCMYCQTMFGVGREVMLIGLQTMEAEKLTHYDVYCPKCRRANRVERKKLELANPNWRESLKEMAGEAAKAAPAKEDSPAKGKPAATSASKEKKKSSSRAKSK